MMPDLFIGDALIYMPDLWNPVDWIIAHKTWMNTCHIEVYLGNDRTVAARLSGVAVYNLQKDWKLGGVLMPVAAFDLNRAMSWFFSKANGQGYDLLGLFGFYQTHFHGNPRRMFCSELATRFYRAGGFEPFNAECDADRISPAQFCQTNAFQFRWRSSKMPV